MSDNNGSSNVVAIFAIIVIVLIAGFILYYAFGKHEPDMMPGTTTNVIQAPTTDSGATVVPEATGTTDTGTSVTTPGTNSGDGASDAHLQE